MHMEYQVTLLNHDFVIGSKHKLITSVIGDVKVVKSKYLTNDAVSCSSTTYIAIRSAKNSGSSVFHQFRDMSRARSLPEFTESFQNQHSREKKVMIVTVDGGPDENPRYSNTINCAIEYFVSIILMHISLPQMHQEEVPLTSWRDECPTLVMN